jgi:hypothetical protein
MVGNVRTEGMRYQPLAMEAAASVAISEDQNGKPIPFRRLAILLPPSMPNEMPHGYQLGRLGMEAARGKGFQESAEIIAEVLSLLAIDRSKMDESSESSCYRDTIKAHLEGNPLLLYYTSVDLLNTVDPTFARIIAEYWEEKLGLGVGGFAEKVSTDELESRRLVLSLITSGVPKAVGMSPARAEAQSRPNPDVRSESGVGVSGRLRVDAATVSAPSGIVACGKKIALANEGHLRLLPNIVQNETHFAQETIYVEETNFESVLLKLKRASPTSLTFIFVHITGRVSADQINHLVAAPASTIKLIFQYSQSLVNLLDLTPSNRDLIHRPESISVSLKSTMKVVQYTEQSAVGAMILYNSEYLAANPTAVCSSGLFWDTAYLHQMILMAERWKENIIEWINGPVDGDSGPAEFLRIVVTPDHMITARELEACLSRLLHVRVIDAGERAKFDELRSFVDSHSTPGFSFSRMRDSEGISVEQEENGEGAMPQRVSDVCILRNATFLPHARLEVLVSRCCFRRIKLILLVSEATSSISRFRVMKDTSSPPVWVRVPIVSQRLLRSFASARQRLAFMGLQLLFSQDAVVSDKHFGDIERFLEGTSSDANLFDFLDHIEGLPSDRTTRLAFFNRLTNGDEMPTTSSDSLVRKTTLLEILALHINLYLKFPVSEGASLVCFVDFCRQPRARFLSQIHRIEGYISYIFSQTETTKRHCASASSIVPLGLPLAICFPALSKNIHSSSGPGQILISKFEIDPESLSEGQIVIPVSQYIDPGRGDVVTQMQEIAEHRAITGAELDWEEMTRRWQSGPEITDDVLDHILIHSPSRLSVLLCMTPPQIVYLSLSSQALNSISIDFDNCQDSLRSIPRERSPMLRTRAAAIWWLLLTKGAPIRRPSEETFAEDQSLLLDSGIYIEPGSEQLLSRVASAMLPLDRPDTFTSQHAVRDFILSNLNASLVAGMLDDCSIQIGQGFMNACVSRETLNGILGGAFGNIVFNKMGNILRWVKDSSTASIENMKAEAQALAKRLTPQAVACLLLSANPPVDLCKARNGIIQPFITAMQQTSGIEAAKLYLGGILTPFCTVNNRGIAVELFDILAEPREGYSFPIPDLTNVSDTWIEIYKAIRDRSNVSIMLNKVKDEDFTLPLEASAKLCAIYVEFFSAEGRDAIKDLEDHTVLLKSELGRAAIYEYMTSEISGGSEGIPLNLNSSALCLLWYCWWSRPWTSFPLCFLPRQDTWPLFQSVARKVELGDKIVMQGLSTIARFSRAPHTLPASMVNALKCAMVDGRPLIISEKYILAQAGSKVYPIYGFRSHKRHLPRPCIESLMREIAGSSLTGFSGKNPSDVFKALFPVTDSGVSVEIIRRNLSILAYIHESPASIEQNRTSEMRAQIFLPTLTWFFSAGFNMEDLKAMCSSKDRKHLTKNYTEMISVWRRADFAKAVVYCPLPVYIDVRYVSGKVAALFQCNAESVNNTVQWLAMLELQYRLASCNASREYLEYAQNTDAGRIVDNERPKAIVKNMMIDIAKVIALSHRNVELGANTAGKYHIVFVLDESGSMNGSKWNDLVEAVRGFFNVRLLCGAGDVVTIITFDTTARNVFGPEPMPIEACSEQLSNRLIMHGGGTAFGPALSEAHKVLIRAQTQSRYEEHKSVLIFMSDGESSDNGESEMKVWLT